MVNRLSRWVRAIGRETAVATFSVTTRADTTDADDGRLSLREALALAAGTAEPDRVIFDASVPRVAP
jgi:hypothetical protein